nr:cupin domain-containing protein [Niveibacterium sp. COAC-50]
MNLHADLRQRAVVLPDDTGWVASPSVGIERRMLDRNGKEQGRATSVVRYAAGSAFPPHDHPGGEEILVLEGVFSDERGNYTAGTYIRNPVGSRHGPYSDLGCTLFVKLWQFDPEDSQRVVIDTNQAGWHPGLVPGLSVLPLHSFGTEHVALVRWAPGTQFKRHCHWGGEEILVLEGTFQDEHGSYPAGSWLRSPHQSEHTPYSDEGCLIFVKTGHLARESLSP